MLGTQKSIFFIGVHVIQEALLNLATPCGLEFENIYGVLAVIELVAVDGCKMNAVDGCKMDVDSLTDGYFLLIFAMMMQICLKNLVHYSENQLF